MNLVMFLLVYEMRKSILVAASKPENSIFSSTVKSTKLIKKTYLARFSDIQI